MCLRRRRLSPPIISPRREDEHADGESSRFPDRRGLEHAGRRRHQSDRRRAHGPEGVSDHTDCRHSTSSLNLRSASFRLSSRVAAFTGRNRPSRPANSTSVSQLSTANSHTRVLVGNRSRTHHENRPLVAPPWRQGILLHFEKPRKFLVFPARFGTPKLPAKLRPVLRN